MSTLAEELWLSWTEAGLVVLTATVVYVATIMATRLYGQRQFSNLSSYDMVFTFALGSVIGRVVLVRTSLGAALLGLVTLFSLHAVTGRLHHRLQGVHDVIQNRPVLLVADGEVHDDQLRRAHVSRWELRQALRQAGHGSYRSVRAVILEPSGKLSVLSGDQDVDREFLDDTVGGDRVA